MNSAKSARALGKLTARLQRLPKEVSAISQLPRSARLTYNIDDHSKLVCCVCEGVHAHLSIRLTTRDVSSPNLSLEALDFILLRLNLAQTLLGELNLGIFGVVEDFEQVCKFVLGSFVPHLGLRSRRSPSKERSSRG